MAITNHLPGITNHLGLFDENGEADAEKIRDFLSLSRKQMADAFGLTQEQIRPERLSEIAQKRIQELAGILELVADIFNGDVIKASFWIKTPNPHFGLVSPRDLIIRGRQRKVQAFVLSARGREANRIA